MKFNILHKALLLLAASLLWACSTQIDNGPNRRLHNLSARYNYIYNANLLLNAYEAELAQKLNIQEDQILPIYLKAPAIDTSIVKSLNGKPASSINPNLQSISQKAYDIIQEKNFSNYLDDAYMLLGKVNYYSAKYYMAAEYFDYVERAYPEDKKIQLQALTWKARTYMEMGEVKMAENLLGRAEELILGWKKGSKDLKAEAYATLAQFSINQRDYTQALVHLQKAQKLAGHQIARTRWNFVAAQLQEAQKDYLASQKLYQKVIHSNAPFELYFQAQLGKLRNLELTTPTQANRTKSLERLLLDDKNNDFQNQIYIEIAKQEESQRQYDKALQSYQKALGVNQDQADIRGQIYLRIAELNFKHRNQYVAAKLNYDSALLFLQKDHPNYESLLVKTENLNYLSSRYQKVNLYDSLLQYAKLNETDLKAALNRKFLVEYTQIELAKKQAAEQAELLAKKTNAEITGNKNFYFSNVAAIQKGRTDFQKKWGKRNHEPNWRQINKPFTFNENIVATQNTEINTESPEVKRENWIQSRVNQYKNQIPQSPADQTHALASIQKALLEIGRFYQHELQDPKETIQIFENYLNRFPESENTAELYYSLYLAYNQVQDAKAEQYKTQVLERFAETDYAKTILDPQYFNRQQALEQALHQAYNNIFEDFQDKKYAEVIQGTLEIEQRFPNNSMQIQFDYLKAIAIGKTNKLPVLQAAFSDIKNKYPQDSLIKPLINKHEQYIQDHIALYAKRDYALLDVDSTEVFIEPKRSPRQVAAPIQLATGNNNQAAQANNQQTASATTPPPVSTTNPITTATIPVTTNPVATTPPAATPAPVVPEVPKIKTDGLYTDKEDKLYYFVVAVKSMSHSLSSSRFGIGQFNRGLYGGENLKHQLFDLEEHQVIFVGDFDNLEDIKAYTEVISAQLGKIMKVPSNLYQGFYISKANFDLMKSSANLDRYLQFYKGNLEK